MLAAGLHADDATQTAASLDERSSRAAAVLARQGIGPGDAVALLLRNGAPFIEASMAAQMLGAYAVPINWHFAAAEVAYVLEDCGARLLVGDFDLLADVAPLIPPRVRVIPVGRGAAETWADDWGTLVDAAEPRHPTAAGVPTESMIYTSGTTGKPKGVRRAPMTDGQARAVAEMRRRIYGHEPGMRALLAAPLYHSAPNFFALKTLRVGGALMLRQRFDAAETLRLIEEHRITHLFMVPTMFVRLLALPKAVRDAFDPSSLRWVLHAGAPCPPDVKARMIDWWGPVLTEYYGSTELGPLTFCTSPEWLARPGTVGRALDGVALTIRDEHGAPCGAGQAGEICIDRTPQADFTYHGDEAKRRAMESHRGLASGDIGYVDEDGYLFICDRRTDMVISGGVNIYPAEVEAALMRLAGIADCAVFGVPDAEYGERLVAFVQPEPEVAIDVQTLPLALRGMIAGYKVPREYHIAATLPRDDSGKIFKRRLRERFVPTAA